MPPPPVADVRSNGLLDDVYNDGGPMPDFETRAGRTAKRARFSMQLHLSNRSVTDREMGEQHSFAVLEALPAVAGMAAPGGGAAILLALNNIQNTMNDIQGDIQNMQNDIQNVQNDVQIIQNNVQNIQNDVQNIQNTQNVMQNSINNIQNDVQIIQNTQNNIQNDMNNIQARQTNAVAREHGDPIIIVTNAAGVNPPANIFPVTYGALLALGSIACRDLLLFYGQPANPSATRQQRLRKFLGAK